MWIIVSVETQNLAAAVGSRSYVEETLKWLATRRRQRTYYIENIVMSSAIYDCDEEVMNP